MRVKLRQLRKAAGLTQEALGKEVGISRTHYCQIEAGEKSPSLKVSLRLKRVLNYPYDDLFFNQKRPILRHQENK